MVGVSRRVLAVVSAVSILIGLSAGAALAAAGKPPVTLPTKYDGLTSPVTLPDKLDPASPYQPQSACFPVDKPGAVKLKNLLLSTYKVGSAHISRGCNEGVSEHSDGRAIDWMVGIKDKKEKKAAADFLAWVTASNGENARRLGIQYLIYNKKIWSIYRVKEGWRPSSGHTDHIHISLGWAGARGDVSFWTGKVGKVDYGPCVVFAGLKASAIDQVRTTPCPKPPPAVRTSTRSAVAYGTKGSSAVKFAQKKLGLKVTGTFSKSMWNAVMDYQLANDLPRTGVLDGPTWVALDPASAKKDTAAEYDRAKAIAWGLKRTSKQDIKPSSLGTEVAIMQTALGLAERRQAGVFASVTKAEIVELQKAHQLKADGIMGPAEWKALAAAVK